jgi:hypothetical protein
MRKLILLSGPVGLPLSVLHSGVITLNAHDTKGYKSKRQVGKKAKVGRKKAAAAFNLTPSIEIGSGRCAVILQPDGSIARYYGRKGDKVRRRKPK